MRQQRKQRLIGILLVFSSIAAAIGLVLFALQQNINLFYTPTQVAKGLAPTTHTFRLGGFVEPKSVRKDPQSLKVNFSVKDQSTSIPVEYTGVLPDLFRENQSVVVEGQLNQERHFIAQQVLAKHDEKYMPQAVRDLLEKQKQ